jgi:hypothetical protein
MRNVISAMKAAVIAAPSAIVNQSDIVFSFQEVGQGMGQVVPSGRRLKATASDCMATRSPLMGEQSAAGDAEISWLLGGRYVSAASRPYLRSRP